MGIDQPPDASGPEADAVEAGIVLPEFWVVTEPGKMLLKDEFERMPQTGLVDPNRIRTLQNSVRKNFRRPSEGGESHSILGTARDLASGAIKPEGITPVRLFEFDGKIWTADHRRIVAARLAGVDVQYEKLDEKSAHREFLRKSTTVTDGLSIEIRKGLE